ncbi:MAG: tRNA (adenosine(37)-N6)-threonylcarbamoyltransferase complex dimerization subunit type 1 TsaB [Janthinobacterium lividum]
MRWMLLIDTCGSRGGVALVDLAASSPRAREGFALDAFAERSLPGRATQEQLMPTVAELLEAAGLPPSQLDVMAVVTGPGSFTGVRIGMAAVKGLAEALGKPVVAVSRLAVLAAQAGSDRSAQAWIDAGRGDVFLRKPHGEVMQEQMVHGADAVNALQPGDSVVVMEERLSELYPASETVPEVGVAEALPLAVAAARAGLFADVALLDANYLRVPDAELARQARMAANAE